MPSILLVEDNKNQRLLIREELEDHGYQVEEAENGRVALAKLQAQTPDLIVLDIRMPEMDGIEALGRIVEEKKDIPVILHTAYSNFKQSFMSWAADAYIVKSSDSTDLLEKIEELLKKKQTPNG
jgi:CheY-like chemotaxis protein